MKIISSIFLALCLSACSSTPVIDQELYGTQIGIVNHTDKYIYGATVGNGGGGHSSAYLAGIANICCVSIPKKWYPGLKLLVQWDMPVGSQHVLKEKLVEVEEYKEAGSVYLHFFSNDHIRIVVTKYAGGSDNHPIAPPPRELYENAKKQRSGI